MFQCQECGRRFKTARAAEKATCDGCPKCGGTDVDLDPLSPVVISRRLDVIQRTKGKSSVDPNQEKFS